MSIHPHKLPQPKLVFEIACFAWPIVQSTVRICVRIRWSLRSSAAWCSISGNVSIVPDCCGQEGAGSEGKALNFGELQKWQDHRYMPIWVSFAMWPGSPWETVEAWISKKSSESNGFFFVLKGTICHQDSGFWLWCPMGASLWSSSGYVQVEGDLGADPEHAGRLR